MLRPFIVLLLLSQLPKLAIGQRAESDTTYYPNRQTHQVITPVHGDSIIRVQRFYSQYEKFEDGTFSLGAVKLDKLESIETYVRQYSGPLIQQGYAEYYFIDGRKRLTVIWSQRSENRYIDQWASNSLQNLKSGNGTYIALDAGANGLDSIVSEIRDSLLHGESKRYQKGELGHYYLGETQNFLRGKTIGPRRLYRSSGELALIETQINGSDTVMHESFYGHGKMREVGVQVGGKKHGLWFYYFNNGEVRCESEYRNGYQSGAYKSYHENGILKESGNYDLVASEVEVVAFNPDTYVETKSIQTVTSSVKQGEWTYSNDQGSILEKENYLNGKLNNW